MRILHLAPTGNWAGTEEMVCRLANDMGGDHEVGVLMAEGEHIDRAQMRERFDPRVGLVVASEGLSPGEQMRVVLDQLGRPDVVHAHLRPGLAHAWHLRRLAPVIGHLHVRYFSAQFWWTDAVVCVSPWQAHDIPASFTGDVFLIPNSIEPFETAGDDEVAAFRHRLGVGGDNGTVYGSVGRLSPEKGFDVLVKAFRNGFSPDDHLVIVGQGPDEDHLRRLAGDDPRIHLPGYVPRARRLLPAFDVYVSASRLDSFGLSVLEAMSVGLPIAATTARGPADLLQDQPAVLVPADDEEALRSAMTTVAGLPRPVSYDLGRYSHTACADHLAAMYERVTTHTGSPTCLRRPRSVPRRWSA